MNFKSLLEKIESSEEFKTFKEEKPTAELVAGFFIIDFFSNDNKDSLDYKFNDKITTFNLNLDGSIIKQEEDLIKAKEPKQQELAPINKDIKIDTDQLLDIAKKEAEKNNISASFNKIIAVLHKIDNKQVWNLTCMLDGLIILNIIIDSGTGEIDKFKRHSMMDFVKKN